MTGFLQLVASLREQMSANLSRSDVLRPLAWFDGALLTALLIAAMGHVETFVIELLAVAFSLGCLVFVGAYIFCLLFDRDALRSESYTLQKMALEQHLLGDSIEGLFEKDVGSRTAIESAATVVAISDANKK